MDALAIVYGEEAPPACLAIYKNGLLGPREMWETLDRLDSTTSFIGRAARKTTSRVEI
jgi:hypothetical protein